MIDQRLCGSTIVRKSESLLCICSIESVEQILLNRFDGGNNLVKVALFLNSSDCYPQDCGWTEFAGCLF